METIMSSKHRFLLSYIQKIKMPIFVTLITLMPLSTNATNVGNVINASSNNMSKFSIDLHLKQQQGEYHPPFVAAWIENSQKKSVRTLLLWRKEPKWLKDIRRWWRNAGRKNAELVDAITSATHTAGIFPLSFSATDDNNKPLALGDYILYIEVVREKGGRALIKQKFNFSTQPQQFTLSETAETGEIIFNIIP
jgi:hypothetical protein